jgi:hydrogenase maturation protease
MRTRKGKDILIVGVGNLLLSDEGVGVAVIRELAKESLPPETKLVDAGCALADILSNLTDVKKVIVIDAVRGGGAPGTIYKFDAKLLEGKRSTPFYFTSLHQIGVRESLAIAKLSGERIPPITIIGIEPETIEPGIELSDTLKKKIPEVVNVIKSELGKKRRTQQIRGRSSP